VSFRKNMKPSSNGVKILTPESHGKNTNQWNLHFRLVKNVFIFYCTILCVNLSYLKFNDHVHTAHNWNCETRKYSSRDLPEGTKGN
jgi:hypothetical protein